MWPGLSCLIINFTFIWRGIQILCFTSHQGSESPGLGGAWFQIVLSQLIYFSS